MQVVVPDYLVGSLLSPMRAIDPTVELITVSVDGTCGTELEYTDALLRFFPNDRFPGRVFRADVLRPLLRRAPRLRWIHNGHTGVDGLLFPELVHSDIVVTNGAGAHKRAIAETVLGFLLADAKALAAHLENQRARRWQHLHHRNLRGQTVAVLGLGRIGLEVALLCHTIGMRVIGTKRSLPAEGLPNVDELFPFARQNECVAQADYVVIATVLTEETRGMVNAATFQAMRPTAALVNIARGAIVEEAALLEALRSGKIRAAYLDVFATEPLPPDSPFFELPNVVATPHNAAWSPEAQEEGLEIFLDNFRRYVAGEPLLNVVDKQLGY